MSRFTWLIVGTAVATGLYAICLYGTSDTKAPSMEDGWWGRGPKIPDKDISMRPFKIQVPNDVISDLKTRLAKTRLGEDLENTQFQYGFQTTYLKEVLQYWQREYNWKKQEGELNKFPQFKTTIEGIAVHFVHVKPVSEAGKKAGRVIVISHGWPGTTWEFFKIIPRLTDPAKYGGRDEDAFEVICPSIPGYGFSEAPHQQGFDAVDAARVFNKLMGRLGHGKYYVQGGDWGGGISTVMAQAFPENVRGIHINFFPSRDPKTLLKQIGASFFPSLFLQPEELEWWSPLSTTVKQLLMETGYFHIQTTKPDTIATGLNDSPAGLAAYILEKFSTWTDKSGRDLPDGGLTQKFTLDELLTNVMIYWVQGNIGSSMRFYKEYVMSTEVQEWESVAVKVPTGLASFPQEFSYQPKALVPGKFLKVVQFSHMPRGGHFAAFEEPELLANDIISFAKKAEKK